MAKPKNYRDPRGHHARIYREVFESSAYQSLGLVPRSLYQGLAAQLGATNNGDISMPLTFAKRYCGVSHGATLAAGLRALVATGLIAVTRKGGCVACGQRLPTLYRLTDNEVYPMPKKTIEGVTATNEWRRVQSTTEGKAAIKATEGKLKTHSQQMSAKQSANAPVRNINGSPTDPWDKRPVH